MTIALWGAVLALLAGCVFLSRELRTMREKFDQRAQSVPDATTPTTRQNSRFGAMYREEPNPMAGFLSLPGGPALALAGLLIVLGTGAGLIGKSEPSKGEAVLDHLVALEASLDSVTLTVKKLSDSLHMVGASTITRSAAATSPTRPNRSSERRAVTAAPSIPPAPVLTVPPSGDLAQP